MTLEACEIEGAAVALYERAGHDPRCPVDPVRLALALPEFDVEFARGMRRAARIMPNGSGGWTLSIRQNATPLERRWLAGHELGESILAANDTRSENVEQLANNIGAAICIPRPAMHALRDSVGQDFEAVAARARMTQTIVALRWSEVFGDAVAVMMRGRIKRRGEMPPDHELRKIERAGGCDGMRLVRFTDSNRSALVATAD